MPKKKKEKNGIRAFTITYEIFKCLLILITYIFKTNGEAARLASPEH